MQTIFPFLGFGALIFYWTLGNIVIPFFKGLFGDD